MRLKFKTFIIYLFTFILLFNISIFAASPNLTDSQKQDIQIYVNNLNIIQNNMHTLAESVVFSPDSNSASVNNTATRIRTELDKLITELGTYLETASTTTPLYRNLLILQNIANDMRSALYELELITILDSPYEKLSTLQRYFYFRLNALELLNLFNSLQSN